MPVCNVLGTLSVGIVIVFMLTLLVGGREGYMICEKSVHSDLQRYFEEDYGDVA